MIGEAAALSAALCWAVGSQRFGRIGQRGDISAEAMNLGKCLSATVLFALTGLVLTGRLLPPVSARSAAWLAASGFVGLALGDGAGFRCILAIGVRRALLLLSTAPVFTAVGGAIWLGEVPSPRDVAAIAAVLVGVAFVVREQTADERQRAAAGSRSLVAGGIAFGLLAGVGQAAGSLMSRLGMEGGVSGLDAALVRTPAGLLGIVVIAALSRQLVPSARSLRRPGVLRAVAAASAIGTYLGIWLAQIAIGRASSTAIASTLLATSPLFALPLARWLDAERITPRALLGTAVACGGLTLLTLKGG